MAEGRKFKSLNLKQAMVVGLAFAIAVAVFCAGGVLGRAMVNRIYLSEDALNARLNREVASFRSYVSDNQVASTNVSAIGLWNRDHRNIQLTVFGLTTTVSSTSNGAELVGNEYGLVIRAGELADGAVEFPVKFVDGMYSVAVYDSSAGSFYILAALIALALAVVAFLTTVLIYDQHITHTVQTLSRQVRQVSRGDLEMRIVPMSDDEIGQLALDVDAMRLSILDKLQREEAAWEANNQLITAVSHDIRTPLTALMGYLEILSDESAAPEDRATYLQICKNNAVRLKSLTDELFGFFLVFGKPVPDQFPEEFDASTLLDQILMEHEMNLAQSGFQPEVRREGNLTGKLVVDLTHLRRVFDNLFSNVNKYADPEKPVTITQTVEEGTVRVTIVNSIARPSNRVESNRIGLRTCDKLVTVMGGEFRQEKTGETFTAEVQLPLVK